MVYGTPILSEFRLRFGAADVDIVESERVFEGYFSVRRLTLKHRQFSGGWSDTFTRELFERGDAVAVLPWNPVTDELIMIEQFRAGALRGQNSPWMLELVAGIVEPDEADLSVVHREAAEEAGCVMDCVKPIYSFYPSAGGCSEQVRLYIGRAVSAGIGEIHGLDTEMEDILVHAIPRADAIALLDSNRINNGFTLIALQWLARFGDALREEWLA